MTQNNKKTPKKLYIEHEAAPNGCDIHVPSRMPVYVTARVGEKGIQGAVDVQDIALNASWQKLLQTAQCRVDDYECGSILLHDGIHRAFMTNTGYIYIDGRIY